MKIRHPLNSTLKPSSKDMREEHADYVLGYKVKIREMSGINGQVKKTPAWELVLHSGEELRAKAAKLMSESHRSVGPRCDIASALKFARESRSCQRLPEAGVEPEA